MALAEAEEVVEAHWQKDWQAPAQFLQLPSQPFPDSKLANLL